MERTYLNVAAYNFQSNTSGVAGCIYTPLDGYRELRCRRLLLDYCRFSSLNGIALTDAGRPERGCPQRNVLYYYHKE